MCLDTAVIIANVIQDTNVPFNSVHALIYIQPIHIPVVVPTSVFS
jgi:hypothetical protein